jgi:retinol dehydrogenase-12
MKDKEVIITGANRGIGKETENEKVFVLELDLASTDSIRNFAEQFKKEESKLDVLINNAGITSRTKKLNNAGIELTFAINVLGHYYLT